MRRRETMTLVQSLDILGLKKCEQEITGEMLATVFRKLSLRHHPDKGGNADQFQLVVRARNVILGNLEGANKMRSVPAAKPTIDWADVVSDGPKSYQEFVNFYSNFVRNAKSNSTTS